VCFGIGLISALKQVYLEIKFNVENTFIADIVSDLHPAPEQGTLDTRNLQFNAILVAPLLEGSEWKFSGYDIAGDNSDDELGLLMDAFAHSVVTHSSHTIALADLQGTHKYIAY
jgi:hypothetical protein